MISNRLTQLLSDTRQPQTMAERCTEVYTIFPEYIAGDGTFDILLFLERELDGMNGWSIIIESVNHERSINHFAYVIPSEKEIHVSQHIIHQYRKYDDPRARFTLCHELGHILLHTNESTILNRNNISPERDMREIESEANAFATEFIMPAVACKGLSVDEIKVKFHVSTLAAERRVRDMVRIKKKKC